MELQQTEVGLYQLQLRFMSALGGGGRAYRGVSLLVVFVCALACDSKCVCHRQARLCVSHTTIIHSHELHALGAEVTVHVYDLSPVNLYSYDFGVGVFHSGIEVHTYTSRLVDEHELIIPIRERCAVCSSLAWKAADCTLWEMRAHNH